MSIDDIVKIFYGIATKLFAIPDRAELLQCVQISCTIICISCLVYTLQSPDAVSYTHLDVYKRQILTTL